MVKIRKKEEIKDNLMFNIFQKYISINKKLTVVII